MGSDRTGHEPGRPHPDQQAVYQGAAAREWQHGAAHDLGAQSAQRGQPAEDQSGQCAYHSRLQSGRSGRKRQHLVFRSRVAEVLQGPGFQDSNPEHAEFRHDFVVWPVAGAGSRHHSQHHRTHTGTDPGPQRPDRGGRSGRHKRTGQPPDYTPRPPTPGRTRRATLPLSRRSPPAPGRST